MGKHQLLDRMPTFDSIHVDKVVEVPFASYSNFADCVSKNKGVVEDPEVYCATIQRKVEGEDINVVNEILMALADGNIGDDNVLRGAQLMPIGKWKHPLGDITVTPERAQSFAHQFKQNVAGQKLPVYYIHSDKSNLANPNYGKAAGWFVDVKADDQKGVLVDIEFTPEGAQAVKNKEFSYLSAEYFDAVQLPHHSKPEKDVIVGAALVNRPHLKGMNPILNEETGHQFLLGMADKPINGGSPMDEFLRQLAEQAQIQISDDQESLTEEQQNQLLEFFKDQSKQLSDEKAKAQLLQKQINDQDPEGAKAKSLAEAGFEEEAKLLSEYRADRMIKTLSDYVPEGFQLTPAAEKVARAYALEQTSENLEELHKTLLSGKAMVQLGEIGRSGETTTPAGQDVSAKILEESNKIAKEQEIELGEAMSIYAKEHPDEWNEYQKSLGAPVAARIGG